MIQHAAEVVPDPDIVLITGDFLGHGLSTTKSTNQYYQLLKDTLRKAFKYVSESYSHIPVLPALGNNDPKFSGLPPKTTEDKYDFYSYLYDIWIQDHPANSKNSSIKETMLMGGYYVYEYKGYTFFSLNTLLWDSKLKELLPESEYQFSKLENVLKSAKSNSVVLFFHYFPGYELAEWGHGSSLR